MQKRARILYHATRAFLSKGFEGANLADIAADAGVGKVTIYQYFTDKTDLLKHVMMAAAHEVSSQLKDLLDPEQPVEDVLTRYAAAYLRRLITSTAGAIPLYEIGRLFATTALTHPDVEKTPRDIFRRELHTPLVVYFEKVLASEKLRPAAPDFLAANFMHMLFFADYVMADPTHAPAPEEIEAAARKSVQLFMYGAAPR